MSTTQGDAQHLREHLSRQFKRAYDCAVRDPAGNMIRIQERR